MVTVKLDRERRLSLKLRGMILYEETTGKSFLHGFDMKELSTRELTALTWACLIHDDPELTFDAVQDMVDVGQLTELSKAVARCIVESFPEEKRKGGPLVK